MSKQISANEVTAPEGMTGIACEPWSKGEVYAVAANWAQASSPVMVYGKRGWSQDDSGRQVADFRHSDRAALEAIIRSAIEMGGDEPEDGAVVAILADAVDIRSYELGEMCDMLEKHGDRFAGASVEDMAQDWLDHDFDADAADSWCDIGVWDAATAAEFRDADKTPDEIRTACEALIEAAGEDAAETYTDGDPIYAACNNDLLAQAIIDACE